MSVKRAKILLRILKTGRLMRAMQIPTRWDRKRKENPAQGNSRRWQNTFNGWPAGILQAD
ncbi:MAG: hypothetical protein ABFD50_21380 [Smithella sp.]